MIFGWLRRMNAEAILRGPCGFLDVERFDGGVRSLPLNASDMRVVEWRRVEPEWHFFVRGVNAPTMLLHPSANVVADDAVWAALARVVSFREPYHQLVEVQIADNALCISWNGFVDLHERWKELESEVLALADALRAVGAATTTCPSCGTALRDRGGLASCDACKGRLIAGDVASERVFDPRGIDPGALKDASVGRGLVARCPSCAHPMAPVLIDDVVADVCKGCGALWCDAGEHARLMGGLL